MSKVNQTLDEFGEILEWLLKHRKDLKLMATVQFSATFTVAPAGGGNNPPVLTPPSANFNLTVGTPADGTPATVVSAGTPPYTYSMAPNSGPLPSGVTFAQDAAGNVTLAGTPTTPGTSTTPVILNVTDSGA